MTLEELNSAIQYMEDLLETSEDEDEKKRLEGIKSTLEEKLKSLETVIPPTKLFKDMTDDEKAKFLQENKEEVNKEMEKEKIQAYADEHKISFEEAEKALKELAEKDAKKFDEEIKRLEEKVAEKDKDVTAKIKALEEKFEEEAKAKKALEDRIKTLTDNEATLNRKLHEADVKAKIKAFESKGIWPVVLELAEAIMLADSGTVKCFEEDPENEGKKKTVDKSIEEAVALMLEAIPKDARIDLEEKTRQDLEERREGKKPYTFEELEGEIKKYADEHSMSVEEARPLVVKKAEEDGRYPEEDYAK